MSMLTLALSAQQQTYTLEQLFNLADQESSQLRAYSTATEAAHEGVQAARSALLPDVNLQLSGSYIGNATLMDRHFSTNGTTDIIYAIAPYVGQAQLGKQDTPHWGNNFSFEATQVLYAGGAISAGIRMAELGEQMASLDQQKQQQEVRFLLTGYYLDLYKLRNQTQVIDQNIALADTLLRHMNARLDQGVVLPNDITRIELMRQNLQLARTQVQDAATILNHQICTTLHLPESTVILPDTTILASLTSTPSDNAPSSTTPTVSSSELDWQSLALTSNLGLRQASLAADLASQQLKATRAASLPHLALVAADNLFGPYTSDLIPVNANVNTWYVGLGVQYNLGSLWRNNHSIRKARLDARHAEENLTVAREGIENGVQACYVTLQTSGTEVRTQQKSVELADQNYTLTSRRYDEGLALLTDMLDASSVKLSADMSLVNARISQLYNYYKLRYLTHSL